MDRFLLICSVVALVLFVACGSSDDEPVSQMDLLSVAINDGAFDSGAADVPIDSKITFVFSSKLDPVSFESQLLLEGNGSYTLSYSNASTKVTIQADLQFETMYTLRIGTGVIGADGERLGSELSYIFTTAADDIIRSAPPCTGTSTCLRSTELIGSEGPGAFEFYSNYPIYEANAQWEELTHAVIVVHGAGHNPDEYYNWMTNTFESEGVSANTILIAPFFNNTSAGSSADFYWVNTNWRRGRESSNTNKISSFTVIDRLIDQLADKARFPVLEKLIITGHSSGAAFTHVYGGSNSAESTYQDIEFEYVVANSQFFYYPDGQRVNESTNQLYTPSGCSGYTIWPLGFDVTPLYLTGMGVDTFNDRFVNRKITYLLGNGNQADPTLNTIDCENTLQGSSRYQRGENMFRYMELSYPNTHSHSKTIVDGIGHDGQGMYQSSEFKDLLLQLLN